jgi:predicted AAA+ superfamily ATPase
MQIEHTIEHTNLPYFDISTIKPNTVVAIVGQHMCGKTTMIKRLLENVLHYEGVYMTDGYRDTDANIDACIGDVLKSDEKNTIILDDIIIGRNAWKNFQKLIFNGKCYRKNLIMTLDSLLYLAPSYRGNLDYIFIRYGSTFDRKRIYDNIENDGSNNIKWDEFNEEVDKVWKADGYQWIVIDNTQHGDANRLFYYSQTKPVNKVNPTEAIINKIDIVDENDNAATSLNDEAVISDNNTPSIMDTIWKWITWSQ